MSGQLFSSSWHNVAALRPQLLPHSQVHRHIYRGQLWYVVQDELTGRNHRLSPSAYALVAAMDGKRTVQELWDTACQNLDDDIPTQDELVQLLSQLHGQDLLKCDVSPDSAEALERFGKQKRTKWNGSHPN